jgi:hypothetical protein
VFCQVAAVPSPYLPFAHAHTLSPEQSQRMYLADPADGTPHMGLEIFRYLIPTDREVMIYYTAPNGQEKNRFREARSLMLLNKHLDGVVCELLYRRSRFCFSSRAHNDLPLFLQNLRQKTLGMIQRVKIIWSHYIDLRPGLRLLLCCTSLQSLELDTTSASVYKYHYKILKCFRLAEFKCPDPRMQEISDIINGQEPRTKWQNAQVGLTRDEKVRPPNIS